MIKKRKTVRAGSIIYILQWLQWLQWTVIVYHGLNNIIGGLVINFFLPQYITFLGFCHSANIPFDVVHLIHFIITSIISLRWTYCMWNSAHSEGLFEAYVEENSQNFFNIVQTKQYQKNLERIRKILWSLGNTLILFFSDVLSTPEQYLGDPTSIAVCFLFKMIGSIGIFLLSWETTKATGRADFRKLNFDSSFFSIE